MQLRRLLALAVLLAACTQERAPRSFVQPNALRKADLQGTWYYVQTVLEAPPSSQAAFIGLSTDLLKIRFDIQEDTLYARRAYEQITGSEDARTQNPTGYLGQPLAAWKISKHFDVIRDYNSTTGEETNKIIESEERAWSQREFIRVDWSRNMTNNYAGLFFFDEIAVEPVSYWESDPGKPEAIHLERADAGDAEFTAGEADYIDLTNKLVVTPASKTLCMPDGICIQVPSCFLQHQLDDCADAVIKVRHAFAKVSPRHQYEPRNWDGKQMELFGLWDVGLNRLSYNRQYGVTNSGISRHSARFNVWKQSFAADGQTRLPYPDRQVVTTPYYADGSGAGFPEDLFPQSQKVIDQWNEAVGNAIADVRGKPTAERVFVFCHNPVKQDADGAGPADPDACKQGLRPDLDPQGKAVMDAKGKPVLHARQGDPRRSRIFWVNEMQLGGPLGYGPPMFDPETGETISGQAYIYGAALDTYAARSRDLVLLTAGKMDPNAYVKGVNVKDWVDQNLAGVNQVPATYTPAEVGKRYAAMDFSWTRGLAPEVKIDLSSGEAFKQTFQARQEAVFSTGIFGRGQADLGEVRRNKARGTPLEAMMITPDVLSIAGGGAAASSWSSLSDAQKARVSPLRAPALDTMIQQRNQRLGALGFDFADFADDGVAQRALRIAQTTKDPKAFDPDTLWRGLRKDIYVAVTLHEMGHNVGLRHNFRASYDSLNYDPKYWSLRDAGTRSTQRFAGFDPATGGAKGVPFKGDSCTSNRLHPRYIDCPGGAVSVEEAQGGIQEYQYSSVMDYGAEFNSDIMGLGHYDRAAMKFSYAGDGYVEVFTNVKNTQTSLAKLYSLQLFSTFYGFPSPINLASSALVGIGYQTYPQLFASGSPDLEARVDVPYSDIQPLSPNLPLLVDKNTANTATPHPMVPYYFCGDEFVGNLTCQRFDAGADAYEQAHDLVTRYENYYLLNNFKRDRYTFYTSASYRGNITGRYLAPLRQQMTWYTLLRTLYSDLGDVDLLFSTEDGWGNFTVGVTEGFDLLGRIISEPEAGAFQMVSSDMSPTPYDQYRHVNDQPGTTAGTVNVGLLDGKYSTTTWDFDGCGYYWADECQTRIGYFLDKTYAIEALTDSQAYFTGRDTSTDVRLYAIGYILPFRNQLLEKFGALLSGDFSTLAPRLASDGRTVEKGSWTLGTQEAPATPAPQAPRIIDPAAGFTLQLYAGVYGLSGFPATYDQSFVDATRIFVVGNGEAPIPDHELLAGAGLAGPQATFDPAQLVSAAPPGPKSWLVWTDQATGKTYAAHALARATTGGGTTPYRIDVAARMLEMARTLEAQTAKSCAPQGDPTSCGVKSRAFQSYRQNVDIMRSLHNAFGYARYTTDSPFYY
jgi:hypothetical protein